MLLSPNHFLNEPHASINTFHGIHVDYSSSLPPDLEISTINTCSRSHACTHTQIHPASAHNKTIPAFMYVCHTPGSRILSHPIRSRGDFCLEREANFLLEGDVYNSPHFNGFEATLKVSVGGWGFLPPQLRPILFLTKTALILLESG